MMRMEILDGLGLKMLLLPAAIHCLSTSSTLESFPEENPPLRDP
jgi:hypothetical protein